MVSIFASPDGVPSPLESVRRQAGGVVMPQFGRDVVVNYGSAAGELAACVSAVGLADCSELTKLLLHGPARQLGQLVARLAGAELAPGGAVLSGGAWWCAETAERLIVIGEPRLGARLRAELSAAVTRRAAVQLEDHTLDWAAVAVVGRRARPLLAELGVYGESGDPRWVAPLTAHSVTGADVLWLLESDRRALAIVPRAEVASVWRAIDHAGQRFGISAVGQQAVARYALIRPAGAATTR